LLAISLLEFDRLKLNFASILNETEEQEKMEYRCWQ